MFKRSEKQSSQKMSTTTTTENQSTSRAGLYLLGIVSLAIVFVFIVVPHNVSFHQLDVEKIHKKYHGEDDTTTTLLDRKIDQEPIHVDDLGGMNNEAKEEDDQKETTTTTRKKSKQTINKEEVEQQHDVGASASSSGKYHPTSRFREDLADKIHQPLLPEKIVRLLSGSVMPKLYHFAGSDADDESKTKCKEWQVKDSSSNVQFAIIFAKLLREKFPPEKGGALDGSGLHWFLDEGGLIGSSRAGALRNADDDFDFFLLLPNLHAPCKPTSLTCDLEEFNNYIHKFLMVFHDEGMCINKFSPDSKRFKSRGRLMYSFQLNRGNADPEKCFQEKKPFAHMHLGIFNEQGQVCTNIWIPPHSTHTKDKLDLDVMLPVSKCRAGSAEVPCPQNITGFLTERNRGEYRRRSADGSCLIVKKKWGAARKKSVAKTLRALDQCGYNSIIDLLPAFEQSGYTNC